MHIETLKTFCALLEAGSFSKVAALTLISEARNEILTTLCFTDGVFERPIGLIHRHGTDL